MPAPPEPRITATDQRYLRMVIAVLRRHFPEGVTLDEGDLTAADNWLVHESHDAGSVTLTPMPCTDEMQAIAEGIAVPPTDDTTTRH